MKEELWLKKIKERLDNYSEDLPSDGWQRLEQALEEGHAFSCPKQKHTRIMLLHRWPAAAAAVTLIAISTLSLWLLNGPAGEEVIKLAQIPDNEVQKTVAASPILPQQNGGKGNKEHVAMAITPIPHPVLLSKTREVALTTDMPETTSPNGTGSESEEAAKEENVSGATEKKRTQEEARPRRKTSLDTSPTIPAGRQTTSKGWSFSLSVGQNGTASEGIGSSTNLIQNDAAAGEIGVIPHGNINLSAMADGVIIISQKQSLAFKEGKPYLINREHSSAVSANHHQPVSVGFSVRKGLKKGFSVETGLMYTFLSSDLRFENATEEVNQKLHYLGIPLRANWNFVETRLFTFYLSAGGAVEKCVYGKLNSEKLSSRPWQFSVLGAVGAQYDISKRVGIYAEPGVSYYFDDHSPLQTIRKERPCSFTLQAGLRLTY